MLLYMRASRLPDTVRSEITAARKLRGWSQAELGKRVGLPQTHISGIEAGKTVPRFDTLLDLVRVLDRDLVMVPRALVPAVQALIKGHGGSATRDFEGERPLYDFDRDEDQADET